MRQFLLKESILLGTILIEKTLTIHGLFKRILIMVFVQYATEVEVGLLQHVDMISIMGVYLET